MKKRKKERKEETHLLAGRPAVWLETALLLGAFSRAHCSEFVEARWQRPGLSQWPTILWPQHLQWWDLFHPCSSSNIIQRILMDGDKRKLNLSSHRVIQQMKKKINQMFPVSQVNSLPMGYATNCQFRISSPSFPQLWKRQMSHG